MNTVKFAIEMNEIKKINCTPEIRNALELNLTFELLRSKGFTYDMIKKELIKNKTFGKIVVK